MDIQNFHNGLRCNMPCIYRLPQRASLAERKAERRSTEEVGNFPHANADRSAAPSDQMR
jgi:hypothetical protein